MKDNSKALVVGVTEQLQLLNRMMPFIMVNASTVCTIETVDGSGRKRGGIVFGVARDDAVIGIAAVADIEAAELWIKLIQAGIDDARRIEAGEAPHAPEGFQRRDN